MLFIDNAEGAVPADHAADAVPTFHLFHPFACKNIFDEPSVVSVAINELPPCDPRVDATPPAPPKPTRYNKKSGTRHAGIITRDIAPLEPPPLPHRFPPEAPENHPAHPPPHPTTKKNMNLAHAGFTQRFHSVVLMPMKSLKSSCEPVRFPRTSIKKY